MGKALRAARAKGLEASTPVVSHHEGVTPVALQEDEPTPVSSGLPLLAYECDADDPTRVAGYAAMALLTAPEAHPEIIIKAQPQPTHEPHSLAPAQQQTVPPTRIMQTTHVVPSRTTPPWMMAFAGVCAALVAGGITLAVLVSADRARARSHVTTSTEAPAAAASMIDVPVVVDPVPEAPTAAPIIVEPLPTVETPEEPSVAPPPVPTPPVHAKPAPVRAAVTPAPSTLPATPIAARADSPAAETADDVQPAE
jgi:hypothetical protein